MSAHITQQADAIRLEDQSSGILGSFELLTLSGETIKTDSLRWRVGAESAVDWGVYQGLPKELFAGLRSFVINQIAVSSPRYVEAQFSQLKHMMSERVIEAAQNAIARHGLIDASVYHGFKTAVAEKVSPSNIDMHLAAFTRLYSWCSDLELDAFDADVATELDAIVRPRAPTGQAVMRQDSNEGPLREFEYQALQAKLRGPNTSGLPLDEQVVTWLHLCFGCNPKNVRLMIEDDLLRTDLPDGSAAYEIRIPRIKKRTVGERNQLRTRHLDPYVGRLVERLIEQNREERQRGGVGDGYVRPLIRTRADRASLNGTAFERHKYRLGNGEIGQMLANVADYLNLRTVEGEPLRLTPRRLRYTFATKLVASGASPQEVADALDHTDTAYVMVYFNTRSDVVMRLDKAIGLALAPIAQAFMGKVIRSEGEADRSGDRASRIRHASPTMQSLETLGSCGSFGFCGLHAPLACYTCSNFQPWMDGPHESVFEELEALRNARLVRGADVRMTQIHDRTMLAVAEVVRRCADLREAS